MKYMKFSSFLGKLYTAQKMKFSIKDFLSKFDQVRRKMRIWSHLPEEILNGKLHFFCAVIKAWLG